MGEPKFTCDYCGAEKSVRFEFYVSYFHIFWIPVFPYSRQSFSNCTHCKQVLSKQEMGRGLSGYLPVEKPRMPIRYFSGIFIVLALILFIFIAIMNENRQTSDYLRHPKLGDVYGIKQPNGFYTLYLLSDLKDDSLGFRINDYEVESPSKLGIIRRDHQEDYGDSLFFWPEAALHGLLKSKMIVNIQRD